MATIDWKDKFNKSTERIKESAKTKVNEKVDLAKGKVNNSNAMSFMKADGAKGKLDFVKNKALGKVKAYEFYKKIQAMILQMQKVISFVVANIEVIGISTLVIILVWNLTIFGISVAQTIGDTPHYYCDIDADEGIRRTALYKQYCANGGSGFDLGSINGHYIVQDGSGPCTCCALNNLLLRYYTANGENYYEYLWNDAGIYSPDALALDCTVGNNIRSYINGGSSNSTNCTSGSSFPNGSSKFASENGKTGYTMSNWGYLRDESVEYEGTTNAYENLANNENWVWDLSLDNKGAGTAWSAAWTDGNKVSINGITATWTHVEGSWGNGSDLRLLLDEHPSGVVVYRQYGTGKMHAILVTGYDEDGFKVVDSGLGCRGGFEGPASSSNFCIQSIWNNDILENPSGKNIISYTYIAEDKP